jgi:hypothetical protein
MLAPGFWLGICGSADLGDFERLCGMDCGELGVGGVKKRWVSAGFCGGLLHDSLGFERGYPSPWGCGVFCREVFCFYGFGGGVWLQNIDDKGVASKILHSGGLRERASWRSCGVWIYFFSFYFSGLEGVGRTRGLPCLARGFAVLGLDSMKRRAGSDLFLGAVGGSLLVVMGFGGD